MIVANRSIIIPENEHGWYRPIDTISQPDDRNFTYPTGEKGIISGIVTEVPAGTDIKPFLNPYQQSTTLNCTTIRRYMPPTRVTLNPEWSGVGGLVTLNTGDFEHDMVCIDQGGNPFYPYVIAANNTRCFGTFFIVSISNSGVGTSREVQILTNTQRSASIELTEYEGGGDGVVTFQIMNGNPYPVKAFRRSDSTYQIVNNAGVAIGAGTTDVRALVTWSSGLPAIDFLIKLRISPEIPYGL